MLTTARRFILLLAPVIALSGCVVVPARPYGGPVVYAPAPVVVGGWWRR